MYLLSQHCANAYLGWHTKHNGWYDYKNNKRIKKIFKKTWLGVKYLIGHHKKWLAMSPGVITNIQWRVRRCERWLMSI